MLSYLRPLVWAIVLGLIALGLGRGFVWLTASADHSGLRAPPQVFEWQEPSENFGGYSALIVAPDGIGFIAGSDRQHYLSGQFIRDAAGHISGAKDVTHWPVLLGTITTVSRFQGDLEGLTRLSDGRIGMAFENYGRLQIMDAPGDVPKSLHPWDMFEPSFGNEMFEAIATLPGDQLLAIFQHDLRRDDQTPAYLYDGTKVQGPMPFPLTPGFDVSGADLGPDGCLYVLERRYGLVSGFQFQLIRMHPQDWAAPRQMLYRSRPMSLGNGEAVSIWKTPTGLVATIITDNGFPPMQPTRIIELALAPRPGPAPGCADQGSGPQPSP